MVVLFAKNFPAHLKSIPDCKNIHVTFWSLDFRNVHHQMNKNVAKTQRQYLQKCLVDRFLEMRYKNEKKNDACHFHG